MSFTVSMQSIDLNCDIGEGAPGDEALMDLVSSVNIACGFHAGHPSLMRRTVAMALTKKRAIGAHPGYPDLQGFGRQEIKMSADDVYDIVLYQVGALSGFVRAAGGALRHVKPHGALYNTAALDRAIALAIVQAVRDLDSDLKLVGLSGSQLIRCAEEAGLPTASEVFADRTYQDNGMLTPRDDEGALIEDPETAVDQVLQMVRTAEVTTTSGKKIPVKADTVCIHGDGKSAVRQAGAILNALRHHGIIVQSL